MSSLPEVTLGTLDLCHISAYTTAPVYIHPDAYPLHRLPYLSVHQHQVGIGSENQVGTMSAHSVLANTEQASAQQYFVFPEQ